MSYVALYRKFRPDTFDEVKGQDHIVETLRNQVRYDRVGHAYLFCGTRGTGKTTLAKLLAKAVNCDHPVDGNPCGHCDSCRAAAAGRAANIVEIDAASNNGVDNIRQINESAQYSQADGKYLVFIIDEVHMLSAGAFNALLKTLEEPPAHVIFILATTEDQKVPVTIQSRCQKYEFHRISVETITERLQDLMQREKIQAEDDALRYIARAADGSMRDALSILDECISSGTQSTLTFRNVLDVVGAVDIDIYLKMMKAIQEDDAETVLDIIRDAVWKGKDLTKFTDDLIWFLRNMYFLKAAPDIASDLDLTAEDAEKIREAGESFSFPVLQRYLNLLQDLSREVRASTIKRVTLEMGFVRMMHPETKENYEALVDRIEKLEKTESQLREELAKLKKEGVPVSERPAALLEKETAPEGDPEQESREIQKNLKEQYPQAEYEELLQIAKNWKTTILPRLTPPEKKYLQEAAIVPDEKSGEEGKTRLRIVYACTDEKPDGYLFFSEEKNRERLEQNLADILQRSISLKVESRQTRKGERVTPLENDLSKIQFHVKIEE